MAVVGHGTSGEVGSCDEQDRVLSAERRGAGAGAGVAMVGALGAPVTGVLLYVVALSLLRLGPGQLPPYTYNWEHYTAFDLFRFWDGGRPWWEMFVLNEGLMTTSGSSPIIVLPALLSWKVLGVGLPEMRLATVTIAALGVPMLWLLARRLVGDGLALVSAVLLAVSSGFLFYGRTATSVGLSVGLALLTAYALLRVVQPDRRSWVRASWLGVFLTMLVVDGYVYSPIRFFWPLAVVALLVEVIFNREERVWHLSAALLTLVWLPLALTLFRATGMTDRPAELNVGGAVTAYYFARGEQVFGFTETPDGFDEVLDLNDGERATIASESATALAWRLVRKNGNDLLDLMLDRQTKPVMTDFWDSRGRLYAGVLVPGVLVGLVILLVRAFRRVEARFLLELAAVFTLPMLLTSRVHIGRLIFALPVLLVIGVIGYATIVGWVISGLERWRPGAAVVLSPVRPILAAMLILLVARATWREMAAPPRSSTEPGIVTALAAGAATGEARRGAAYVAGDLAGEEVEALDVAADRLHLADTYQFVNLAQGEEADPADARPPLYYGGLIDLLGRRGAIPSRCDVVYYVRPDVEPTFQAAFASTASACIDAPRVRVLDE